MEHRKLPLTKVFYMWDMLISLRLIIIQQVNFSMEDYDAYETPTWVLLTSHENVTIFIYCTISVLIKPVMPHLVYHWAYDT